MEETCHVMKRKKRKTRRCLNEMKKKLQKNTSSAAKNIEVGTKMNNDVPKMVGSTSHNNFITSNRLTLSIFPKAVRSETITRPLLAEIRHEPGNINLNNILRNKQALNPESAINEKVVEMHANNVNNNSANMFSDGESEDSSKENCINSVIFRMESGSDVPNDCDAGSADECSTREAGGSSPPGSPQLIEEYAYSRYRQFIKDIPMYIQMHAPSLLAEDPMKKPKALLQNLYLEGRRRLIEHERLASSRTLPSCTAVSLHEPILENPIDYLKRCSTATSFTSPDIPSQSPTLSETPSPPPPSPQGRPSTIEDTPEYTYFPHKLNQ